MLISTYKNIFSFTTSLSSSLASVKEKCWFYFNILLNLFILHNLPKTFKILVRQKKQLKKTHTHRDKTPLLAEVILCKIHCQVTHFYYCAIQPGTRLMIITQKKDIIHPVYIRESSRRVQLFEKVPKYRSNSIAT